MKFSEEDYTLAGIVCAYPLTDIEFSTPLALPRRRINSVDDFRITSTGGSFFLPVTKSEGVKVKESQQDKENGRSYRVTLDFDLSHVDAEGYAVLQKLRTPHHLILTHLGDRLSVIRATESGWQFKEESGKVTIEIHNPNGQQRIL